MEGLSKGSDLSFLCSPALLLVLQKFDQIYLTVKKGRTAAAQLACRHLQNQRQFLRAKFGKNLPFERWQRSGSGTRTFSEIAMLGGCCHARNTPQWL